MNTPSVELVVPLVHDTLTLNMSRVLKAERRGEEVAMVTPEKAPELLATFNRGYLDASEFYARLRLEYNRAEDSMNRIKAIVLIDKIPGLLKEKGLSTSADVREALIEADPEYQAAKEKMDFIGAMLEYLKGKMKYLENAYTSVKKIMDTGNWQMQMRAKSVELNGMSDENAEVGSNQSKFGRPL
jgi:hypothetical protein